MLDRSNASFERSEPRTLATPSAAQQAAASACATKRAMARVAAMSHLGPAHRGIGRDMTPALCGTCGEIATTMGEEAVVWSVAPLAWGQPPEILLSASDLQRSTRVSLQQGVPHCGLCRVADVLGRSLESTEQNGERGLRRQVASPYAPVWTLFALRILAPSVNSTPPMPERHGPARSSSIAACHAAITFALV